MRQPHDGHSILPADAVYHQSASQDGIGQTFLTELFVIWSGVMTCFKELFDPPDKKGAIRSWWQICKPQAGEFEQAFDSLKYQVWYYLDVCKELSCLVDRKVDDKHGSFWLGRVWTNRNKSELLKKRRYFLLNFRQMFVSFKWISTLSLIRFKMCLLVDHIISRLLLKSCTGDTLDRLFKNF